MFAGIGERMTKELTALTQSGPLIAQSIAQWIVRSAFHHWAIGTRGCPIDCLIHCPSSAQSNSKPAAGSPAKVVPAGKDDAGSPPEGCSRGALLHPSGGGREGEREGDREGFAQGRGPSLPNIAPCVSPAALLQSVVVKILRRLWQIFEF